IGLDLGITNVLATSAGDLISNPRYIEKKQHKLAILQQQFAEGVRALARPGTRARKDATRRRYSTARPFRLRVGGGGCAAVSA
ncbi:MAG: hypothetical protein V4464_13050, partial [Pseudomonadota bacterium]